MSNNSNRHSFARELYDGVLTGLTHPYWFVKKHLLQAAGWTIHPQPVSDPPSALRVVVVGYGT